MLSVRKSLMNLATQPVEHHVWSASQQNEAGPGLVVDKRQIGLRAGPQLGSRACLQLSQQVAGRHSGVVYTLPTAQSEDLLFSEESVARGHTQHETTFVRHITR